MSETPPAENPSAIRRPNPAFVLNVPNALTLARLPLTVAICACIAYEGWAWAFATFLVAALTDVLDGWWRGSLIGGRRSAGCSTR